MPESVLPNGLPAEKLEFRGVLLVQLWNPGNYGNLYPEELGINGI